MGAQQILDTILLDAELDAQRAVDEAKAVADDVRRTLLDAAQATVADIEAKAAAEAAELEQRQLLTAGIEARKLSLAKKRALLDDVFAQAKDALRALDGEKYRALVTKLVVDGAQTGRETLVVPTGELNRYTKPYLGGKTMLELLNEALTAAGKTGGLTLGDAAGDFAGGVRLVGEKSDVDCSFGTLVDAFRDGQEAAVFSLLFKTEE